MRKRRNRYKCSLQHVICRYFEYKLLALFSSSNGRLQLAIDLHETLKCSTVPVIRIGNTQHSKFQISNFKFQNLHVHVRTFSTSSYFDAFTFTFHFHFHDDFHSNSLSSSSLTLSAFIITCVRVRYPRIEPLLLMSSLCGKLLLSTLANVGIKSGINFGPRCFMSMKIRRTLMMQCPPSSDSLLRATGEGRS